MDEPIYVPCPEGERLATAEERAEILAMREAAASANEVVIVVAPLEQRLVEELQKLDPVTASGPDVLSAVLAALKT